MAADLVLNRRARRLAGDGPLRRAILDAAARAAVRVHETTSFEELDEAARAIAQRGSRGVILAGGDGSYMAGVTALARAFAPRALPAIALAPGGTVSTVARNWGGPRATRDEAARALVEAVASGRARATARSTLRVTDDRGGDRVGFIFGAGLVARFFDEYYASAHQVYAGAARIVARVFAGSFVGGDVAKRVLDPVDATLSVDGHEAAPRAWSLVLASVVRDVGLHMIVTPRAGETQDAFHAVASPLGPRLLGPQMPRVLAGLRLLGRNHVDAPRARDLRVRFAADDAYVLDGDVIRARQVRVTPGPPLEVLAIAP